MSYKRFGDFFAVPLRNGLTKPKAIRGAGIKMVNMGELFSHSRIIDVPMDRVPMTEAERKTSLLEKGDLLFARQSLVLSGAGKCSIFIDDDEDVCFESHVIRCRLNKQLADPYFFYYYFLSPNGRAKIEGIVEQGAGVSGIRGSDLSEILVPDIDIETQRSISNVLVPLDDKILENSKISHHLKQMAQAIFKSWFVDFERSKPFTEVVQVLGGGTPKTGIAEYWNGEIPFFTPKDALGTYVLTTEKTLTQAGLSNCNSRLYPVNTVFVTARGTVGKLTLAGCPMAMNQSCYALVGSTGYGQHYVYHLAQYVVESLKHKASGAVFDAIVTRDFESEIVPDLTTDEARPFEEKVAPIYEAILNYTNENLRLDDLRDTLLPRLISGELSVADLSDAK